MPILPSFDQCMVTISDFRLQSLCPHCITNILALLQASKLFLAAQCCEHLNRALVVERTVLERLRLTEVSAVPVPKAGGSMAAFAYKHLKDPCLVESIEAHGGIDIGETLIGMHLRRVAIPFRSTKRYVGKARVTAAWTRPKLIGGERAVYKLPEADSNLCD